MKKFNTHLFYLGTCIVFSSCGLFKSVGADETYNIRTIRKYGPPNFDKKKQIQFSKSNNKKNDDFNENNLKIDTLNYTPNYHYNTPNTLFTNELRLKYIKYFDEELVQKINLILLENIDEWYGTPYKIGGKSKSGIDCSSFTNIMYYKVYNISLNNNAAAQYQQCVEIKYDDLKEGDLVFFKSGRHISHVGIYISNNKFVHASTSEGVKISSLNENYWYNKLYAFGRVKN